MTACPKCRGWLVFETVYHEGNQLAQWRCLNCGWLRQCTLPVAVVARVEKPVHIRRDVPKVKGPFLISCVDCKMEVVSRVRNRKRCDSCLALNNKIQCREYYDHNKERYIVRQKQRRARLISNSFR